MSPEYRNIYKIARESAGITQERAAELLDVSVESMRAYEYGKRIPPDKVVIQMIEIYNTQFLAYQHLKEYVEAAKFLPDIQEKDLAMATLSLFKELNDVIKLKDIIIEIASNGKINTEEINDWTIAVKEMTQLCGALLTLIYASKSA